MTTINRELVKQYKNGNKIWRYYDRCEVCGGSGFLKCYAHHDDGVCYYCSGSGVQSWTEKELTPENQKKEEEAAKIRAQAWQEKQQELDRKRMDRIHRQALIENERFDRNAALRKAEAESSEWQSEIGKRITIRATLSISLVIEGGRFGDTWIHVIKDKAGNVYKWKTDGPLGYEFEEEGWDRFKVIEEHNKEEFTLKGTVKEHAEYKGVKQTVLTRCKVTK